VCLPELPIGGGDLAVLRFRRTLLIQSLLSALMQNCAKPFIARSVTGGGNVQQVNWGYLSVIFGRRGVCARATSRMALPVL
jgi:hypothetical protein